MTGESDPTKGIGGTIPDTMSLVFREVVQPDATRPEEPRLRGEYPRESREKMIAMEGIREAHRVIINERLQRLWLKRKNGFDILSRMTSVEVIAMDADMFKEWEQLLKDLRDTDFSTEEKRELRSNGFSGETYAEEVRKIEEEANLTSRQLGRARRWMFRIRDNPQKFAPHGNAVFREGAGGEEYLQREPWYEDRLKTHFVENVSNYPLRGADGTRWTEVEPEEVLFDYRWRTPLPDAQDKREEATEIRKARLRRLKPHAAHQKRLWEEGGALPQSVVAAMRAQGRSPTRRGRRVLCEGTVDQQKGLLAMLLQEGKIMSGVTPPWQEDDKYLERWIEREDYEEENAGRMVPMLDPNVAAGSLEWGQLQATGCGVVATTGVEAFCETCYTSHMRGSNKMTKKGNTYDHFRTPDSSDDEHRTKDTLHRLSKKHEWDKETRNKWATTVLGTEKPFCSECKTWTVSPWGFGCECWRYCEACPGMCTKEDCRDPRGLYLCGCTRENGRYRTVWKATRNGKHMPHWINPCPEDHYDPRDTRHLPLSYQHETYATKISENTAMHTTGVMRDLAAMGRDEATVITPNRSDLPEQREAIVRGMWSRMGPGSEVGHTPRDLTGEEVRLMVVMMTQGDWPPEMVAGAEAYWATE
jgi:hypothetical protein